MTDDRIDIDCIQIKLYIFYTRLYFVQNLALCPSFFQGVRLEPKEDFDRYILK